MNQNTEDAGQSGEPNEVTTVDEELTIAQRVEKFREKHNLSIEKVASKAGIGGSSLSLYLSNKYPGSVDAIETKLLQMLDAEFLKLNTGVGTTESAVSFQFMAAVNYAKRRNKIAAIIGESGFGKSRAVGLFKKANATAAVIQADDMVHTASDLREALIKEFKIRRTKHKRSLRKRFEELIRQIKNSGRVIVIDDAHYLTQPALRVIYNLYDRTFCPIILAGTEELADRLMADTQRASRTALRFDLELSDQKLADGKVVKWRDLIVHMVREFAPDLNGAEFKQLCHKCETVAEEEGHFRSVEHQLDLAKETISLKPGTGWLDAFDSAATMLFRKKAA